VVLAVGILDLFIVVVLPDFFTEPVSLVQEADAHYGQGDHKDKQQERKRT